MNDSTINPTADAFISTFQTFTFSRKKFKKKVLSAVENDDGTFTSAQICKVFVKAARLGLSQVVNLFLTVNKNLINVMDSHGDTALTAASSNGHEKVVACLLDVGADVDKVDRLERTPLCLATLNDHVGVAMQLLGAKADANKGSEDTTAPLWWAAFRGYEELVTQLIAANADVNPTNRFGETPLAIVAFHGHEGIVKQLLSANADVNKTDIHGKTPLYKAAYFDNEGVVKQLLAANADINKADKWGQPPLFWAAFLGFEKIVKQLLVANAEITDEMTNRAKTDAIKKLLVDELEHRDNIIKCGERDLLIITTSDGETKIYKMVGEGESFAEAMVQTKKNAATLMKFLAICNVQKRWPKICTKVNSQFDLFFKMYFS